MTWRKTFAQIERAERAGQRAEALKLADLLSAAEGAEAQCAAAGVWLSLGQPARALETADRLLAAHPANAMALYVRGHALGLLGRREEGLAALARAVELAPHDPHIQLAQARQMLAGGRVLGAVGVCRTALVHWPEHAGFASLHSDAWAMLGDADAMLPVLLDSARRAPDDAPRWSRTCFVANSAARPTPGEVFEVHEQFGRALQRARPAHTPEFRTEADPDRVVRVGIVTSDCRRLSSVAFFLRPLLDTIDRARFEIAIYYTGRQVDAVTEHLKSRASTWRHVPEADDHALPAMIRADRIDVALDLIGHSGLTRLGVFQPRCAPVQVSYLGYSNTSGLKSMDWRMVDSLTDPAPAADALATERLWRLDPCFLCYRPDDEAPPTAVAPCLWTRRVTFGSFSHHFKLNTAQFRLWARVLNAVPGSRLVLKNRAAHSADGAAHLRARLAESGVDLSRVDLKPRTESYTEHLSAYGSVDVALDTFPYNGTTTICEALSMGVPLLALTPRPEHDRHAARVGLSLVTNAGLPELVARDEDHFVEIAAGLARDPDGLSAMRTHVRRSFLGSPVCDAPAFGARFGKALREIWRRHCTAAT